MIASMQIAGNQNSWAVFHAQKDRRSAGGPYYTAAIWGLALLACLHTYIYIYLLETNMYVFNHFFIHIYIYTIYYIYIHMYIL